MSANYNKFIDRSPSILSAGIRTDSHGDSVSGCMKEYLSDDAKKALLVTAGIPEKEDQLSKYPIEPFKNHIRRGVFTEIRPLLRPEVQTRYQTLINELKETSQESHWNKVLGKGRDQVPGLPKDLDKTQFTFGRPGDKTDSMKLLVNPPKGPYQVLSESQIGHELYKKTHYDYNIGEKICRNYLSPPFDKDKRFGAKTKYDPRGIWVRCCCHWHKSEPAVYASQIQADYFQRSRHRLGECLTPNNIIDQFPVGHAFGKPPKRDLYGVEELLKDPDCPPCVFKRDLKCWLKYFNKLKTYMKKRCNTDFNFEDLRKRLKHFDRYETGMLPLETFYEACTCYRVHLDKDNLEPFLRLLSIVRENKIDFGRFLDILDYKRSPVEMIKIQDLPLHNQYYLTTNQAALCDYLIINNADGPAAGVPSNRYDLERPIVPPGRCRADLENLGEETSAAVVINPSIYMNYGLSFRDFFMPRQKETIRSLFEKTGHPLDDASFDKLWQMGVDQDKTGLVCVDTFNKLLAQHYPAERRKLVVDEATC